tara:strand:- start:1021 stop:1368 length:348 start_codon:yes stop_codon:yes gene_type:complete
MFKNLDYIELEMGGNKHRLVATHTALFDLEDVMDCGLIDMMQKMIVSGLKPRQIVSIILIGLKGNNDTRLTFDDVAKAMFSDGAISYHKAVSGYCQLLLNGMSKDDDLQGKSEKG